MRATSARPQSLYIQTHGVHAISVTDRDRTTGHLRIDLTLSSRNVMTEADIGMAEHRSKNTLGRSVPVKIVTDVEDDGTSEDGSPRPVCAMSGVGYLKIMNRLQLCRK